MGSTTTKTKTLGAVACCLLTAGVLLLQGISHWRLKLTHSGKPGSNAIAAEEATFGLSEINFKLFPGGSVSKSLANLLRPRDALWYGLTGEPFNGSVAAQIGFVNKAVPLAKLADEARKAALTIAQKDPWALKATKDGYRNSLDMGWDAAIDYASAKEMELVLRQGDAFRKEGIGDFLKGAYRPGLESHSSTR